MINQTVIAQGWVPARLEAVRAELRRRGLHGFVVPRWDAYQGEYCAPCDERLAWISGFTGSWGSALITEDRAVLFVDGRYTVQAREQVSSGHFEFRHLYDQPMHEWLLQHAVAGQAYGYDAAILSPSLHDALADACVQVGARMVASSSDPIDAAWIDRPQRPVGAVRAFALERAGEPSHHKRSRLAQRLRSARVRLLVETQPDNIAWLLNLRGDDVSYSPMPHAMALIDDAGEIDLCIDQRKLIEPRNHYELDGVRLHAGDSLFEVLRSRVRAGDQVSIDPKFSPSGAVDVVRAAGGRSVIQPDPLTLLKAIKNGTELAGLRASSRRDSVAWIRFLMWLERAVPERDAAGSPVTEYEAEEVILAYRRELPDFVYPSFRTISAADGNGAMCHYAAAPDGEVAIRRGSIYLVDSGGQYLDGTTDTTRTVCFASPPAEVRRNFTLVLKGHARLASALFPQGTFGHQIDALAREPLWRHGLDYDHGTGHGVGHFLSVHEQPQRLMKTASPAAIEAGMTLTNEPGYYEPGRYGIRIENLCEVVRSENGFLCLRELTLVPIDRRLIDVSLLEPMERAWLDNYHIRVRTEMSSLLTPSQQRWLADATVPI